MRKSKYSFFEEIDDGVFLHYSALTNRFLLLNSENHSLFESCSDLENLPKRIRLNCEDSKFFVDSNFDETAYVDSIRQQWTDSSEMYHIVVNPTLDCNLNCWYCYENRIVGSKIDESTIDAIKRNIEIHYSESPYSILKLSFFGGEPFLCFEAIRLIVDFTDTFCEKNNVELILDFTSNATLIDGEVVDYLSKFHCHFQITLDGDEEQHLKVKRDSCGSNTYQRTLEALRLIDSTITNRHIAVRVNFDNRTLRCIDSIIKDISFMNRPSCYVILKKVWQVNTSKVDKEALMEAIQKLFDAKFLVDYYVMPKGCLCFAERRNQALINYDGGVFKCTTICSFDKENALGTLDNETGKIIWSESTLSQWFADMQPRYCKECKWYPACMGICNRQILAHSNERICTFDAMNLTQKEYLMYLFKYNLLLNELNGRNI